MKKNLLYLILIVAIMPIGCKAQKEIQWPKFLEIKTDKAIIIWIDNSNPIAYVLNFQNDSLNLIIYTHMSPNNLLITKKMILSDTVTYKYFEALQVYQLRDCETYDGYNCSGLDGVTMKVEFLLNGQSRIYEYWSPQDQKSSLLGQKLLNIKETIEKDFKIPKHISEFISKLKKGSYGNYGESVMTK